MGKPKIDLEATEQVLDELKSYADHGCEVPPDYLGMLVDYARTGDTIETLRKYGIRMGDLQDEIVQLRLHGSTTGNVE